jgi:hypothetical protein
MSGLFSDDEDDAVEKLKRAGSTADKTIFTAPERHADDATAQVRLALLHPPGRRLDPPTPNETVRDRLPKPDREMRTYELEEDLKRELERMKREGEGDEQALRGLGTEQLKREFRRYWPRRLLFDPRSLRGE